MTTEPFSPVLRTQADVEAAWRHLIRPLGWSSRRLWFMFVGDDDRPLRQLSQVDDLPARLDPKEAANAARAWRGICDELVPGGRVALLLCRPGRGGPTPEDRNTATTLYDSCREAGLALEVIHLATDEEFFPLPYDLVGKASA